MNSARDALRREKQHQQEPFNVYRRRKYTTSDEIHTLLKKAAVKYGMTIQDVLETLILDALKEGDTP